MQVTFYSAGEITQVLDAIPRVRCASGNVWHIRFTFANTFANTFAYFAEFECKTNCEHTYPLIPGPPETTLWQRVKLGIEAGVSKVGEAENLDGFRLFRACCLSGTDVCPPLESALKESSSFSSPRPSDQKMSRYLLFINLFIVYCSGNEVVQ